MEKITILALHLGYGGVEKSIASLCNILIKKYDVEVISVYKLYDKPAFYIDDKVEIKYLLDNSLSPNKYELKQAVRSKNILKLCKELFKSAKILTLKRYKMIQAIKKIYNGVVISTRIEHNRLLSKYRNKGVITIAQEHTDHNGDYRYINNLVKSCENIDYFIPVSQRLTDFYKGFFDSSNTKCVFIPHSLDYIPDKTSKLNTKNIVSIGRLSPEKGFMDLIEVFRELNERYDEIILNIIGDGSEKESLQDKIKEYNLEDKIILHGYKDKEYIDKILRNSSIYVMTSYEESFGIVLIEAQSYGIPCVAFNSAKGACEIISDNSNGYLIDNRSKEDMVDKILDLMLDEEKRISFGIQSRNNSYKYSLENISLKWYDFLKKVKFE